MPLPVRRIAAINTFTTGGSPTFTLVTARTYLFDDLLGSIAATERQIRVSVREGVDGQQLQDLGKRGAPFQLLSRVYVADLATCWTALRAYQALVGEAKGVVVTQEGVHVWPCDVLGVQFARQPQTVASVVGSIVANPTALLECVWTLIARDAA